MQTLVELGIAREVTGRRRNRLFAYDAYLTILREGTEPLPFARASPGQPERFRLAMRTKRSLTPHSSSHLPR